MARNKKNEFKTKSTDLAKACILAEPDYRERYMRAISHAGTEFDNAKLKGFVKEWVSKSGIKLGAVWGLPDTTYAPLGPSCWVELNGGELSNDTVDYMKRKLREIVAKAKAKSAEASSEAGKMVPRKNPQETIKATTGEVIAEIEENLDTLISKRKVDFELFAFVRALGKAVNVQLIRDYYEPILKEMREATGKKVDAELKEAYEPIGKFVIGRQVKFLEGILSDCDRLSDVKKAARKPRKTKAKPATKKVDKLKYMNESTEYKIVSVDPTKIIGANALVIFNVKYRELAIYYAADEKGLDVAGTTVQNVDLEASLKKRVRKPEVMLPQVAKSTKAGMKRIFSDIKSKAGDVTGRINQDTILLKVYK